MIGVRQKMFCLKYQFEKDESDRLFEQRFTAKAPRSYRTLWNVL